VPPVVAAQAQPKRVRRSRTHDLTMHVQVREKVAAAAGIKLVAATKQLNVPYKAVPGHEK